MKAEEYFRINNLYTEEEINQHFKDNAKNGFGLVDILTCPRCGEILKFTSKGYICPECSCE